MLKVDNVVRASLGKECFKDASLTLCNNSRAVCREALVVGVVVTAMVLTYKMYNPTNKK